MWTKATTLLAREQAKTTWKSSTKGTRVERPPVSPHQRPSTSSPHQRPAGASPSARSSPDVTLPGAGGAIRPMSALGLDRGHHWGGEGDVVQRPQSAIRRMPTNNETIMRARAGMIHQTLNFVASPVHSAESSPVGRSTGGLLYRGSRMSMMSPIAGEGEGSRGVGVWASRPGSRSRPRSEASQDGDSSGRLRRTSEPEGGSIEPSSPGMGVYKAAAGAGRPGGGARTSMSFGRDVGAVMLAKVANDREVPNLAKEKGSGSGMTYVIVHNGQGQAQTPKRRKSKFFWN